MGFDKLSPNVLNRTVLGQVFHYHSLCFLIHFVRLHQPAHRGVMHAKMVRNGAHRMLPRQLRQRDRVNTLVRAGKFGQCPFCRSALRSGNFRERRLFVDQFLHFLDEGQAINVWQRRMGVILGAWAFLTKRLDYDRCAFQGQRHDEQMGSDTIYIHPLFFLGRPVRKGAARRALRSAISSRNRSSPSAQPLCRLSRIALRSAAFIAARNKRR